MSDLLEKKSSLLSSVEAAELLGVTSGYITRLCREGKISGVREDGLWFVERSVLERYRSVLEAEKAARAERLARERLMEYRAKAPVKKSPVLASRVALVSFAAIFFVGSLAWAGGGVLSMNVEKRLTAAEEKGLVVVASEGGMAAVFSSDPSFTLLERSAIYTYETINEWFSFPVRVLASLIAPAGTDQIVHTFLPGTHSTTTVIERVVERGPLTVNRFVTEVITANGISEAYLREQLLAWRNATTEDILDEINDRDYGSGDGSSFDGVFDGLTITNSTLEGPSVDTDELLAGNATSSSLYTNIFGLGSDYLSDVTGYGLAVVNGELTVTLAASPFATSTADFWFSTKDTDDLAEGSSNLYYQDGRVLTYLNTFDKGYFFSTTSANAFLATKSTTDIAEGTNQYFTLARFASALAGTTTDALAEGATNKYFSNTLARNAVSAGTGLSYNAGTGVFSLNATGGWTGTFDGQEGSYYLDRTNHTGTQLSSTISDFPSAARGLFSSSATGLTYTSGTGVFSLTSGYNIPLTASTTDWNTAFNWGNHAVQNYFDKDTDTTTNLTEGSKLFYTDGRVLTYLNTFDKGYFFSTTSANFWETQQTPRTADDLSNNSIEDLSDVASMTKTLGDLLSWNGSAWVNVATSTLGISGGGGGPAVWGAITGTLSNQTDLQNALNAKLSLSDWYATTTDALDEGSTNLYFTNTRADARIAAATSTIRNMFSAGSGLTYSAGQFALNATGDWTGTFDGQEGTYYLDRANHTGTQLASTISDFSTTARGLFSSTATGLTYTSGTGVFSLTGGYSIPLTASTTDWNTAYLNRITSATYPVQIANNVISLAFGTTTANTWGAHNIFSSLFATNASTTNATTTSLGINSETFTDLTGAGLSNVGGVLTLNAGGDWTGTFDGQEGSYYLARANHTGTQFASTISDFASTARGLFSSTATGLTYTSGTGVFSLTAGYVIPLTASTTDWNTAYLNRITSATYPLQISSNVLSIAYGTTTANTWSQLQTFSSGINVNGETITDFTGTGLTNSGGALTLNATGDWTGTFDGQEGSYYLSRANHTGTQLASTISDFSSTARGLFSNTATGLTYTSGTGVFSLSAGYAIPLTASTTDWNTAYVNRITSATYPLQISSNVLSIAYGTTTANTWSALQTFSGGASTTAFSANTLAVGGSGTTTIGLTGALYTPSATIGTLTGLLYGNAGAVAAATVTSPLTFSAGALGINNAVADGSTKGAAAFTAADFNDASGVISLDYTNGQKASATLAGFLTSADWTTFNAKLASSSLQTSALLASLLNDETGSGLAVFGTSPTFSGTPVFSGGLVNYSVVSTSTVPNNQPYAWTIATSTTGRPLFRIDTTSGSEAVTIGAATADVLIGDVGSPSNLIFEENSTIRGQTPGRTLTFGAGSDIITFGVDVGMGNMTPFFSTGRTSLSIGNATNGGMLTFQQNGADRGFIYNTADANVLNLQAGTGINITDGINSRLYVDTSTGTVGIGTTTPTALFGGKLAVAGPIFVGGASTTATSTFEGNVRVIGNLAVGSGTTWIRDNATSSFNGGVNVAGNVNVTGAIMQNGVALSNPWTASGSDIYFNTGNLGIGTTSPNASLTINGNPASGKLLSIVAPSYATSTTIVRTYTANATWTKPANVVSVKVEVIGAGGGGSGGHERSSGYSGGAGAAGGNSVFSYNSGANVITGGGGGGGSGSVGAAGTASGGDINISGSAGATSTSQSGAIGAAGVTTILDGYAGSGGTSNQNPSPGGAGGTGTGAGGGGGGTDGYSGSLLGGASGGSGGYASKTIVAGSIGASASITVGVGGGGGGGASNTAYGTAASGGNGGTGATASGSSGGPGSGGGYSTSGVNRAGNGGSKGGSGTYGTGSAGGGGGSADIYGSYAGGGGGGGSGGLVIVTEYYEGPAQTFSALTVTTEGSVGVGTTSPKASLTVAGQLDSKNALLNVAGRRSSITRVYNKSGTWTKPAGLSYATIEVVGGGGGGAGSTVYYSSYTGYGGSGASGSASQVVLAGGTVTGGGGGGGNYGASWGGGSGGAGGTPANSFTGSSRSGASGNAVQGTIPGSGAHSVIDGATPTAGAGGGYAGGIAGIGYGAGGGAGGYQSNGYPGGGGGSGAYVIATVPAASIGTTSTVTVGVGGGGGGGGAAMTGYPNSVYSGYNASGSSGAAGGNDTSYSSGGTSYTTGTPGGGAGGVSAATVAGTAGSPGYGGGGGGGGAGYIAAGAHVSGYGGGGGAPGIVIITEYYDTPQAIDALNVTSTGNVGIGNTSATYLLDVGTANLMGPVARFVNATGYCTINPTTAGISCSSDQRLKKNIEGVETEDALAKISALAPVLYNWNAEDDTAYKHAGFIAQEVQQTLPDLVSVDEEGFLSVNYAGFTPYLVSALQQLNVRTLSIERLSVDPLATTTYAGTLSVGGRLMLASSTIAAHPEGGLAIDTPALSVSGSLFGSQIAVPATTLDFTIGSTTLAEVLPPELLTANGNADLYKMAGYAVAGVAELVRRTDLMAEKLETIEARLAALETTASTGLFSGIGSAVENSIAFFQKLKVGELLIAKNGDKTSAAGAGYVLEGNTVVEVKNPVVKANSKIFITLTSAIDGSWYISEKKDGSFRITLSKAQDADVTFDYFIVSTEGDDETTQDVQHGPTETIVIPPTTPTEPEPTPPEEGGEETPEEPAETPVEPPAEEPVVETPPVVEETPEPPAPEPTPEAPVVP